jgi:hypothetical protein
LLLEAVQFFCRRNTAELAPPVRRQSAAEFIFGSWLAASWGLHNPDEFTLTIMIP